MSSRITPDEPFPEDLSRLKDHDVEVLNSKVHREIDYEIVTDGEVEAETAFRNDELSEELDGRDVGPRLTLVAEQQDDDGASRAARPQADGAENDAIDADRP